jgi:Leucine-rich repeat (LRR) protein
MYYKIIIFVLGISTNFTFCMSFGEHNLVRSPCQGDSAGVEQIGLEQMPPELIEYICSFLSLSDIKRLRQCSRTLSTAWDSSRVLKISVSNRDRDIRVALLSYLPWLCNRLKNFMNPIYISLYWAYLKKIPLPLLSLNNVRRLYVDWNEVQDLTPAIQALSRLEVLSIGCNKLKMSDIDQIAKLPALTDLDIRENQLKDLPESFYKLKNLKSLALGGNLFPLHIIARIGLFLINLQKFDLVGSRLQAIPEQISQLQNLRVLLLAFNQLSSDSLRHISRLPELQKLDVSYNDLHDFPLLEGPWQKLTSLVLTGNYLPIHAIASLCIQFPLLRRFCIAGNGLQVLPDEITRLPYLSNLDVACNEIEDSSTLAKCAQLHNLKKLDLSHNYITKIPEEIFTLTGLKMLYLKGNKLSDTLRGLLKQRFSPATKIIF